MPSDPAKVEPSAPSVRCPRCDASPNWPCVAGPLGHPLEVPHPERTTEPIPREFYSCPQCGSHRIEQNGAGGRHTRRDGRRYYQSGWWCWECKPRHYFLGAEVEQFDHTETEKWCPQCKEAPCLMTFAVRGTPMPGGEA